DNRTVKLWSVEGRQPQSLLSNETFNDVGFSNDGKLIATYSGEWDNRTAKLWSVEGKQPQSLLFNETFNYALFSNDGKLIATFSKGLDNQKVNGGSSDNQTVKLWTRDGKELDSFPPNEKIHQIEFSPDGKLIATLNRSNYTVKFWKLAENQLKPLPEPVNLEQYSFNLNKVQFSPDSKLIATFNNNQVIQVWNRDGKKLARLNFNESIEQMSFSPNSKILAISSKNKALILWNLKQEDWEASDLKKLVEKACEKVGNYLRNKPETESDKHLCDDIGTQK
ncbi:WD40 repeat domain-containing protein, partial [Floridanema aerugineum]